MPSFFLGILLIFIFSLNLRWLPPIGFTPIVKDLGANLTGMILPSITLGAGAAAVVARLTRSSLLEVLGQEYIRTARAKGLADRAVIYGHALKNAMIPVVTIVGLQVGTLLGGAIITETIFVLPGVGKLAVDAIFARDFPMLQGCRAVSVVGISGQQPGGRRALRVPGSPHSLWLARSEHDGANQRRRAAANVSAPHR